MRHQPPRGNPALHVTVVADNPETLDGLAEYFGRVGVGVHGTRRLLGSELVAQASSAVVFFPDDFEPQDVTSALDRLKRARRRFAVIVVTANPERFDAAAGETTKPPVILTRPAWGWTILDAIRDQVGA